MAIHQGSTVVGVFRDRSLAEQTVAELRDAGWDTNQVRILGKGSGGVLDSLKSAFSNRDTSATDELASLDLPAEQRALYERELAAGSTLVVADARDNLLETRDVFQRHGAYNVFLPLAVGGEHIVPVREEVPNIEKRVVDVGEIRIHKRIITEQRTFTIPVTREEVTIERLPRNAPAQPGAPAGPGAPVPGAPAAPYPYPPNPAAPSNFPPQPQTVNAPPPAYVPPQPPLPSSPFSTDPLLETPPPLAAQPPMAPYQEQEALPNGGTLRILVREEQVFINKTPVVVEEIVIHKQPIQETRQFVTPLKHEEIRVEQTGNVPVREQSVATPPNNTTASS